MAALELDHLVGHRVLVVEGGDADPEAGFGALAELEGGLPQPVEDVDSGGSRLEGPLHEIGGEACPIALDLSAGIREDPPGVVGVDAHPD